MWRIIVNKRKSLHALVISKQMRLLKKTRCKEVSLKLSDNEFQAGGVVLEVQKLVSSA